ncbi:N-acetylglucosamine-6-phosphate deacetylase [Polymorphobacter fuscus]|uniref:N-acetylglucosamine-6-phosphate deacetylase n=1 Tax=Sandarakinorhabdus fusca TaxID=1439888 RepID=A0A7C9KMX0_9SPHN|nr:N-acetylglucosamine-6-phosphate deacetylase [Polymorphobacter fuscus]KAB7647938.1 N-acetylglucosamine-6-phosphate deacetylase [Polymorphobacter fuscus]MQT17264.1 N-acetylglucosamine-6-phosphate deacetylase [Polymorphobacter fuscus]NJC08741.1 N-acetylglucosamine-6-phosphate deacetylase [Polymorphobacter fuscus]
MSVTALVGAAIVQPDAVIAGHALLIDKGRILRLVPDDALPGSCRVVRLEGGWLLPGFIDTQVNGGGDVLLNDRPDVDGIAAIARAHRRFGTTALLPTLISDDAAVIARAMAATEAALAAGVPGVWGLHLEGPHLNPAKKGIHDAARFTPVDLAVLLQPTRGRRLVTLAPELAPPGAIRALAAAGVIVAAGHSMADYGATRAALAEGLAGFTHLFNAMTPLGSREPGMVGAALDDRASHFGLIVDGVHVHPATLRIALAARGLDGAMLVTDAMPPVGGVADSFTLMGQAIRVVDGTCRGADGTLAGSALDMATAVRNAMDLLGVSIVAASKLASGNPARFLRIDGDTGAIRPGLRADLVHLDADRQVTRSWIGGEVEAA